MAISAEAMAAVNALYALDGAALANGPIKKNAAHLFEKHWAKAAAWDAAEDTGRAQGYFKFEKTVEFKSKTEFNEQLSANKRAKWMAEHRPGKRQGQLKRLSGTMTVTAPLEASAANLALLLEKSLECTEFYLCKGTTAPNTRFLYVTPIPAPFIGRAIDDTGTKDKNIDWMCVVINGSDSVNPALVTVYPASKDYVWKFDVLT